MSIIDFCFERLFGGNTTLVVIFAVAFVELLLSTAICFAVKSAGLYASLAAIVGGSVCIAVSVFKTPLNFALCVLAVLSILGGALYIALFCTLAVRANALARKSRRAENERKMQYALPVQGNSFVRERLTVALQARGTEEDGKEPPEFSHAQKLLLKVKAAPLSTAERLEADELTELLSLYLKKERFGAEDIRVVNEAFARLLKLSAKYAV